MSNIVKGKFTKEIYVSRDKSFKLTGFSVSKVVQADEGFSLNRFKSITLRTENLAYDYKKIYEIELQDLQNARYPHTYAISKMTETNEVDTAYILKFLSSNSYRGIGIIRAQKMIDTFGDQVLEKIKNEEIDHNDLDIAKETYDLLVNDLKNNEEKTKLRLFLYECGLSDKFYEKVLANCNAKDFYDLYENNPWPLYFQLPNVRFDDIKKIAIKFNKLQHFDYHKVLIYDYLNNYLFDSGNTRIMISRLLQLIKRSYPDYANDDFFEAIKQLQNENRIVIKGNGVFIAPKYLYDEEKYIIMRLKYLHEVGDINPQVIETKMLDKIQKSAVELALSQPLSLITGAPGTGKTLVTNEIIKNLLKTYDEEDIAVVTPTGRATININRHNMVRASTIHSLLRWDTDTGVFGVGEESLSIKVLIVDEFSMVPTDLFYFLLKAINRYDLRKIVLVGDKNQLPAIGPGYLINDFINNDITNTIYLEKNYRQNENYEIIEDAKKINESIMPDFKGKHSQFIETESEKLADIIISKTKELLDMGYTKKQIAILSPIYNYQTGIDYLNERLQEFYSKLENEKPVQIFSRNVYLNDKVINLENDTNKNVFNGEIGYVERISRTSGAKGQVLFIFVVFEDGKTISYTPSEFNKKTMLAYCTSVHKYQGSESDIVLTVLFNEARMLLSKKLIYTAITRAKKLSIIYGQQEALEIGITNDRDSKRSTFIKYLWDKYKNIDKE